VQSSRWQVLGVTITVAAVVILAGCSSSAKDASHGSTTSSTPRSLVLPPAPTGDPNETPNPIPYNVGEPIGLPNGWRMQVTRVHRPYAATTGLTALSAGQQYVGVDLAMGNDGTAPVTVDSHKIFLVSDSAGGLHAVLKGAAGVKGLDGTYAPGARRSGSLVFAVPVGKDLQLLLDGPAIHTQKAVFQVDPPTTPLRD
jgi:hypothetical protein